MKWLKNAPSNCKAGREKRKEAAKKAWETIRKKKRLERMEEAKTLAKIESFILPSQIARIKHPEDVSP